MLSSRSQYSFRTFIPGRSSLMNSASMMARWKAPFLTDARTLISLSVRFFCINAATFDMFENWLLLLGLMFPKPDASVVGCFPDIARFTTWTCYLINDIVFLVTSEWGLSVKVDTSLISSVRGSPELVHHNF